MISGFPSPFNRPRFWLVALLVGGGIVVAAVLAIRFVPPALGVFEGPAQPIAFPHTIHVQQLQLDCRFCHRTVDTAAAASIPAVEQCMFCHKVVTGGQLAPKNEQLEELKAAFLAGTAEPVNWARVHRVPDTVHFVHEPHIRVLSQRLGIEPTAVCATCHGDIGSMTKVSPVRSLRMGDCVDCHRQNNAPTDCTTCHY